MEAPSSALAAEPQFLASGTGTEPAQPSATGDGPSTSKAQLILTLGRVKTLIKEDADVKFVSSEAYFAIAKATELLLEAMTDRAAQPMLQSGRSQLGYGDVAQAVSSWQSLDFLGDVIPHKIPAGVVLQKMLAAKAAAAVA
ncbi:hypothetical protein ACKKBF_B33210 [Auxenochlorella protothecoides x Auxenochlorella symbiontica]